jgi:HAD superfamily hydrolase (TIGR01509 family)
MDKKYAIFDMDGTLVDSMGYWRNLAAEFLKSQGIPSLDPSIREKIKPLTVAESAALFIREYNLTSTPEQIARRMNTMMEEHYLRDISLKPGAMDYLNGLSRRGVQLCVASATAEPLMQRCLRRLGILDRFSFILSCEAVGVGKTSPDVYYAAAERLGSAPADTAVYEDALYAARTAADAGFYVVGVYDVNSHQNWKNLVEIAAETIFDWTDASRTDATGG